MNTAAPDPRLGGATGADDDTLQVLAQSVQALQPQRAPTPLEITWRRATRQLREYAHLTRLHRPIGTLLLLWPVLWALWIACDGPPDLRLLAIFVAGTVLTRSAGCVINDFADRNFDPHVRRTRERPLAARRVSPTKRSRCSCC